MLRNYNEQWAVLSGLMVLLLSFCWVRPQYGSLVSLLFSFSIWSTIWVWLPDNNRYATIEPYTQQALKLFAVDSSAKLLIFVLPFMLLPEEPIAAWGRLLAKYFVIFNSLWILISFTQGCSQIENACSGIVGNPSICAGLLVAMLPMFITSWKREWWILILTGVAVLISKSSIALGLFAVYGMLHLMRKRPHLGLAFFAGAFIVGSMVLKKQLFHDSDRLRIWNFMLHRWPTPANLPFGTGLGTFHVFSINLQAYGVKAYPNTFMGTAYWWNTFHNDFLQFLFECGVVGMVLFVATYALSLIRAYAKDYGLFLSALLFGFYMLLDPALHNPFACLFAAWLFTRALRQPNIIEEIL